MAAERSNRVANKKNDMWLVKRWLNAEVRLNNNLKNIASILFLHVRASTTSNRLSGFHIKSRLLD